MEGIMAKPFGAWKIGHYDAGDYEKIKGDYPPLLSALLCAREIIDLEQAKDFLRDDLDLLGDPFLMRDMDKAVTRILQALQMRERIAVFGDYDVDGITATSLVTHYLRGKGAVCEAYIPDRLTEGYGISEDALKNIASSGSTLVITVDCGVTAVEQCYTAKQLGLEIVITDHHECPEKLPEVIAVVDPRRKDCEYPFKGLAGVGVAFKLLCALEKTISGEDKTTEMLERYGDLTAIGTIADIMPVTGENRTIIRKGIEILRKGNRCGLRKLMDEIGLKFSNISGSDLSFMLVPKLNAAGRMGQVGVALDMVMTESDSDAEHLARRLCELTHDRRDVDSRIFTEICERLTHGDPNHKMTDPIVVAAGHWHHGVSGIVASRLADKFGVPSIVICWEDGIGRGSGRSFGNFSIFDALLALKDELTSYGGHFHAAGLTIKHGNLPNFINGLRKYYRDRKDEIGLAELPVDFTVDDMSLLSMDNVNSLADLSPWGPGNAPPILALTDARLETITPIGGDRHLKLKINKDGQTLECVWFGVSSKEFGFKPENLIDIAFEPIVNEFRGMFTVQLVVRDIHHATPPPPPPEPIEPPPPPATLTPTPVTFQPPPKSALLESALLNEPPLEPIEPPQPPMFAATPPPPAAFAATLTEVPAGQERPAKPPGYSRKNDALALCRKFLDGAELSPIEKILLKPSRADLVAVWTLIKSSGKDVPSELTAKVDRLTRVARIGNPSKTYLSLKVFEQAGLIRLDESDGKLGITLLERTSKDKADLEATGIMSRLS
jgi:single-stranded-DNA-specific exonuclease